VGWWDSSAPASFAAIPASGKPPAATTRFLRWGDQGGTPVLAHPKAPSSPIDTAHTVSHGGASPLARAGFEAALVKTNM